MLHELCAFASCMRIVRRGGGRYLSSRVRKATSYRWIAVNGSYFSGAGYHGYLPFQPFLERTLSKTSKQIGAVVRVTLQSCIAGKCSE